MPNIPGVPDHAYETVEPDESGDFPVEPKTKAALVGGGAGGVAAGAVLWGLDELFWNGDAPPDVPGPVAALVWLAVPAAIAYAASYYARHVNRTQGA